MAQVALVTGAARGIGFGTAKALAHAGFSVALNGLVEDPDLTTAVAELACIGPAIAAPFDVTDLSQHAAMLARIEDRLGPLTTLVNNAGVGVLRRGDPLDVTEASWDRCMNVNAKAVFFLTQAFSKQILSRPRDPDLFHAIITVSSSNARAVAEPRSEYAASKAAAAMITQSFAVRLGRDNIAVYDVQPGLIDTEMTAPVIDHYADRARAGLTLFPRIGTPSDVGQIIATLATGKLPYTTGQVISADAGLLVPRF